MPKLIAKTPDEKKWLIGRSKIITGFCNNINKPGQCEGTKPTSGGKALPTCESWLECPCECHYRIDEMFNMTGLERKLVPNPDYDPPSDHFVMPVIVDDPLGTSAVPANAVIVYPDTERPVNVPHSPAMAPLAHRRTETGRAAKGGLEAQVWDACCRTRAEALTPKQVGEWIVEQYKIPTPSSGAINAVWDRWERLGFCEQTKKPNRFLGFTGEGTWEELARLKGAAKREHKSRHDPARRTK